MRLWQLVRGIHLSGGGFADGGSRGRHRSRAVSEREPARNGNQLLGTAASCRQEQCQHDKQSYTGRTSWMNCCMLGESVRNLNIAKLLTTSNQSSENLQKLRPITSNGKWGL